MNKDQKPKKNEDNNDYTIEITELSFNKMKCCLGRVKDNQVTTIKQKDYSNIDQQTRYRLEQQKIRKCKSNLHIKSNLLYLNMLLLIIDSQSQIEFNRIKSKKVINKKSKIDFHISSIISQNKEVFNDSLHYQIDRNIETNWSTIKFNEETGCPQIDETKRDNFNSDQQCRIIQHILLHTINKILKPQKISLDYTIKKSASKYLSSIILTSFLDFDWNGQLVLFQKSIKKHSSLVSNEIYQQLSNSLVDFISYFLDSKTGKTQQIIIGDEKYGTYGLKITDEITFIGRQTFITSLWSHRKWNVSMKMIFEQPEIYIYPYFNGMIKGK